MKAPVVLALGSVITARQVQWPSKTIRFPYVSDVSLEKSTAKSTTAASSKTTVMAHSPALDAAGLLQPGTRLLLTKNPSTCKTPYAIQLLEDEGELVLANPICANRIANRLIEMQLIPALKMYKVVKAEVTRGDSRFDLLLQHRKDTSRELLVEVKHVSTVDVAADAPELSRKPHFVVRSKGSKSTGTYSKTALFPVDKAQKKRAGENVVSERAIKHIVGMQKLQTEGEECCILFIVTRGDAKSFRPCEERCPVFAREIRRAHDLGVKVLAPQISWDWKGNARFKQILPVKMPRSSAASSSKQAVPEPSRKVKKAVVKKKPATKVTAKK
eukprot:TRINITY_DN63983_c0_g1_i1.p1 TRINITY_DN63983_c0_g1~~TRINITY_DN63983_c0_g1_i1.p1  ORF type:complete len:329 (+),score=60.31 TRINITY_DN63983_c0_g1_i1:157-1143(+)